MLNEFSANANQMGCLTAIIRISKVGTDSLSVYVLIYMIYRFIMNHLPNLVQPWFDSLNQIIIQSLLDWHQVKSKLARVAIEKKLLLVVSLYASLWLVFILVLNLKLKNQLVITSDKSNRQNLGWHYDQTDKELQYQNKWFQLNFAWQNTVSVADLKPKDSHK